MATTVPSPRLRDRPPLAWAKPLRKFLARVLTLLFRRPLRFIRGLLLWATRPLRQMSFRFGVAHALTGLATVLLVEALLVGAAAWVLFGTDAVTRDFSRAATYSAAGLADTLRRRPGAELPLTQRLDAACSRLQSEQFPLSLFGPPPVAAVVGPDGRVLAAAPGVPFAVGRALTDQLPPEDAALIRTLANTPARRDGLAQRDLDGSMVAVAPVLDPRGRRLGLLAVRAAGRLTPDLFGQGALAVGLCTIPFVLILGGVSGAVFGRATARPLARRLRALSDAADAWGRGDLSATIDDWGGDEVGDLGRRLGAMAGELRRHVRAQQRLATLEERNRLARDLHDTVKQQAFAAAMQLGAARTVLGDGGGPAGVFVAQAERLTNKVQEDLMALIHELRPAVTGPAQAGAAPRGLPALLRDEVLEWSQASGMPADVRAADDVGAGEDVAQALLRVAQEALANVARHSRASRVRVELWRVGEGRVELTVADDGEGFDPVFTARGMGLYSMRDRALSLPAGRFSLDTAPGRGVTVRASCAAEGAGDARVGGKDDE